MVKSKCLVILLSLLAFTPISKSAYYPNYGDLYYNGQFYLDSYFLWSSSGPWNGGGKDPRPAYEHDLSASPSYITSCTTITNLPSGYDDCPTAGVLESGSQWVFSFGSYDAKKIVSNVWYFGAWGITHGLATTSPITLRGQENIHDTCPFDNIWCMESVPGNTKNLLSTNMNWLGYPTTLYWIQP